VIVTAAAPPNHPLRLTGAATLVSRDTKLVRWSWQVSFVVRPSAADRTQCPNILRYDWPKAANVKGRLYLLCTARTRFTSPCAERRVAWMPLSVEQDEARRPFHICPDGLDGMPALRCSMLEHVE